MKYLCSTTLYMAYPRKRCFTKGKIYTRAIDFDEKLGEELIDDDKENHYVSEEWLKKYFTKIEE